MRLVHTFAAVFALAFVSLFPGVLRPAQASELEQALLLPELFEIMAEEGRASVLGDGAVPLQDHELAAFRQRVAEIYQPDQMLADFVAALEEELSDMPEVRADTLDFANSELGREIMRLEISGREALLDDEIDHFARMLLQEARAAEDGSDGATRLADIRQRIAANDLIELNVTLGLNTSFAYYRGMMMEDAVSDLTSEMLVQLVWAQEDDIRADIEDWIESYFLMAYQPLDAERMAEYLDYVDTPLAREFNRAMFRAFDTVFSEISLQLGQAVGRAMSEQEL